MDAAPVMQFLAGRLAEAGTPTSVLLMLSPFLIGLALAHKLGWLFDAKEGRDIRDRNPGAALEKLASAGADLLLPGGNPGSAIQTIYGAGRQRARRDNATLVFRTKLGWRLGYPVVAVMLLSFLLADGMPTIIDVASFTIIGALIVWLGFYIWSFRVEVDHSEMRCMTMLFDMTTYDLAALTHARDFDDSYTLHFADGGCAPIPRYVEGHDTLKEIILSTLHINGR
ncbi:hypothetical protein [Cognatishimia sp. F0-27]|uniref:hypothetical protein n=1 Tax=Cognatishimia sp. F0-27 TaxID=2816855 RepID=UPI001D0C6DDF|nr:hypothetical protein [Cognatishimia sp. F0-27]MCC1493055.1 hypothetical protein [Cognatishimia sp. F0-27]